jgi:K+-sensing histidine kinase KdpD
MDETVGGACRGVRKSAKKRAAALAQSHHNSYGIDVPAGRGRVLSMGVSAMRKNLLFGTIVAFGCISATALISLSLTSMQVEAPYLLLLLGTLAAAMIGGSGAGLSAIALATFVTWFFFIPPVWSLAPPSRGDALTIVLFLLVAFASTRLYYRQRKIIDELNAANVTLRQQLLRIGRPALKA